MSAPIDEARFSAADKYFPGLQSLRKVLVFSLRLTGAMFGLLFVGGPLYLIMKFLAPVLLDPRRQTGEQVSAATFGVFALIFIAVGAYIFVGAFRKNVLPEPRTEGSLPSRETMLELARNSRKAKTFGLRQIEDGTYLLSSANLYRVGAVFTGIFALVWNTVIFFSFRDLHSFGPFFSVFQFVFMAPFFTVGVGLVYVCLKLLFSLRQPVVEFGFRKALFDIGEKVRAEVRLRDPKRLTRRFSVMLRKRRLAPNRDSTELKTEPWIFEERTLLERDQSELDGDFTDSLEFEITESPGEWAEWTLEAKAETGRGLPLYLVANLPFERET